MQEIKYFNPSQKFILERCLTTGDVLKIKTDNTIYNLKIGTNVNEWLNNKEIVERIIEIYQHQLDGVHRLIWSRRTNITNNFIRVSSMNIIDSLKRRCYIDGNDTVLKKCYYQKSNNNYICFKMINNIAFVEKLKNIESVLKFMM